MVVHGKPSFFLGRGTLSLRVDDDPRGRHRRAAGPHRAAAQAAGRRGAVRPGPQAPAAVPARLHRADHRPRLGRRARRGDATRPPAGPRCGSGSSTPRPRARWPCRRSSTRSGALDRDPQVDVIVLARGGGSVEDLLPFSDETLCRAVAACRTPVVSAIGHEPDTPLVDHVADLRCSTPDRGRPAAGARPRRGDRPDRRAARPGPAGAGRLGGPRGAAARRAARTARCWPTRCARSTRARAEVERLREARAGVRCVRGLDRRARPTSSTSRPG